MITNHTKDSLISFEEDIVKIFENKEIKAPIHLDNGNEDELIKVFQDIKPEDHIYCTWRSHYKVLLKGVPPEQVKEDIKKGKSISLCYPEYNIFSSAIVGGSIPIAVGAAAALKLSEKSGKVYCFVGDMASECGIFNECFKYSVSNQLPIKFIIEDNNKSVCTNTRKTWNVERLTTEALQQFVNIKNYLYYYQYESKWPHSGGNSRIQF